MLNKKIIRRKLLVTLIFLLRQYSDNPAARNCRVSNRQERRDQHSAGWLGYLKRAKRARVADQGPLEKRDV
jgi:hypothetical protein